MYCVVRFSLARCKLIRISVTPSDMSDACCCHSVVMQLHIVMLSMRMMLTTL
jgi:hypothetical protein